MRPLFSKAFRIYKYLALLFTIGYWIYALIDDWHFIEEYWDSQWPEYLAIWALYFLLYFVNFSVYFWLCSLLVILIYRRCKKG